MNAVVDRISLALHAGSQRLRLSGREGGHALKPGSYTVSAVASEGALKSSTASTTFAVKR